MVLLLVFMQLTRDLFAIAKFLLPLTHVLLAIASFLVLIYEQTVSHIIYSDQLADNTSR